MPSQEKKRLTPSSTCEETDVRSGRVHFGAQVSSLYQARLRTRMAARQPAEWKLTRRRVKMPNDEEDSCLLLGFPGQYGAMPRGLALPIPTHPIRPQDFCSLLSDRVPMFPAVSVGAAPSSDLSMSWSSECVQCVSHLAKVN